MIEILDDSTRELLRSALRYWPVIALLSWLVYQRYLSPFAGLPGPYWASLSRAWIAWHSHKGDLHLIMMRLHEKFGPLVRIGPTEV